MTDNTQFNADDELREKIDECLSHFEVSVDGIGDVGLFDLLHPRIKDKYGNGVEWAIVISDRIMEAIMDWHNKQVEAVLDRLELNMRGKTVIDTADGWKEFIKKHVNGAIEAERNKLKGEEL